MPSKNTIESVFNDVTGRLSFVEADTVTAAREFVAANSSFLFSEEGIKQALYSAISRKLKLNEGKLKRIYSYLASKKLPLDFHEKNKLENCYVDRDFWIVESFLNTSVIDFLSREFPFYSNEEIISAFESEVCAPLNRRTKVNDGALSKSLVTAIFAEFVFSSVPREKACLYFDKHHVPDYIERVSKDIDYFSSSSESLSVGHFSASSTSKEDVFRFIYSSYKNLKNHGYVSVVLELESARFSDKGWALALDAMAFAEKSFTPPIRYNFFKPEVIKKSLISHVPDNCVEHVDFSIAHYGYQYLDSFYILNSNEESKGFIVLIFELNHFSEDKIPCPACRSDNVQGNSYSKLGVKSWECNNLICPDRSRTNRGKRFSLYSIIRQHALLNEDNIVDRDIVKKWNRDVVYDCSFEQISEMLVRFYSEVGDRVVFYTVNDISEYGRHVEVVSHDTLKNIDLSQNEDALNIYKRKFIFNSAPDSSSDFAHERIGSHDLYCGDSNTVLRHLGSGSVDVAITSPPYYNAKEYAQWPNIYAYLNDMYVNAKGVFDSLKEGGIYLFNIFDYFDNEKDIVFSAMGRKRLVLSSQIKLIFDEIGFNFIGNIVWDKGHIEGKRGFNGGNYAPFFQHPFNCWEHVLVFSKGQASKELLSSMPALIKDKPVFKIVKGENTYGHTAPFPLAIPNIILDKLKTGSVVLDPYSGSFTTSVSAQIFGHKSIGIEWDDNYFELGKKRLTSEFSQPSLVF